MNNHFQVVTPENFAEQSARRPQPAKARQPTSSAKLRRYQLPTSSTEDTEAAQSFAAWIESMRPPPSGAKEDSIGDLIERCQKLLAEIPPIHHPHTYPAAFLINLVFMVVDVQIPEKLSRSEGNHHLKSLLAKPLGDDRINQLRRCVRQTFQYMVESATSLGNAVYALLLFSKS